MNISQVESLYQDYLNENYVGDMHKAEEIFDAVGKVRSLASARDGLELWVAGICEKLGAKTTIQKTVVVNFMTLKLDVLRLEFDEDFAEAHFESNF